MCKKPTLCSLCLCVVQGFRRINKNKISEKWEDIVMSVIEDKLRIRIFAYISKL